MEIEKFISGYCRTQDQSRMVAVVIEDGSLSEVDCCFGSCVYEPNCTIAEEIRKLLNQE